MRWVLISLLGISLQTQAQSRVFMARMEKELPARDSVLAIEKISASKDEYDFLVQGTEDLESLFLGSMYALSRNHPDELMSSKVLTIMASAVTSIWKGGQYNKGKSWTTVTKYIRRASYRSTCRFNLLRSAVFRISLVDNEGKRFYYDRLGPKDQLNLFNGSYPTFKERMDEDRPEPEALHFFSEEKLVEQFERQLRKQSQYTDLRKGNFCCVGISVEVDQNTLHRKKIPTARVIVLFGARRLKHLKKKDQLVPNLAEVKAED